MNFKRKRSKNAPRRLSAVQAMHPSLIYLANWIRGMTLSALKNELAFHQPGRTPEIRLSTQKIKRDEDLVSIPRANAQTRAAWAQARILRRRVEF